MPTRPFYLFLFAALLGSCAPQYYQSVTLASDTAKVNDSGDFLFENDTVRVAYDFHSQNGHLKFSILNKLKQPLYVNWKESGFVQGSNFVSYWQDQYVSNGYLYDKWFDWNGYFNLRGPYTFSIAKREDQVSFIPPGTELMQFEFVVQPGNGYSIYTLQKSGKEEAQATPSKKDQARHFVFSQDSSALQFRHYLTFSTDAESRQRFALDSRFWARSVTQAHGKTVFGPMFGEGYMSAAQFLAAPPSKQSKYLGKNKFVLRVDPGYPSYGSSSVSQMTH